METKIKHKVVLIDTLDKSIIRKTLSDKLILNNNEATACPFQHLYILSNEKINVGDWYLTINVNNFNHMIAKCSDESLYFANNTVDNGEKVYNKIVASTNRLVIKEKPRRSADDFDLEVYYDREYIPNIPEWFINEYVGQYNEGNVIEYVDVLYDKTHVSGAYDISDMFEFGGYDIIKPKLHKNNTISISLIKNSWDRKEVVKLVNEAYLNGIKDIGLDKHNKWINENI